MIRDCVKLRRFFRACFLLQSWPFVSNIHTITDASRCLFRSPHSKLKMPLHSFGRFTLDLCVKHLSHIRISSLASKTNKSKQIITNAKWTRMNVFFRWQKAKLRWLRWKDLTADRSVVNWRILFYLNCMTFFRLGTSLKFFNFFCATFFSALLRQ